MLNPEIDKYVSEARAKGIPGDAIRQNLTAAGWSPTDVESVFKPTSNPITLPVEQFSTSTVNKNGTSTKRHHYISPAIFFIVTLVLGILLVYQQDSDRSKTVFVGLFVTALLLTAVFALVSLIIRKIGGRFGKKWAVFSWVFIVLMLVVAYIYALGRAGVPLSSFGFFQQRDLNKTLSQDWTTYKNELHQVTLDYPPTWSVNDTSDQTKLSVLFQSPTKGEAFGIDTVFIGGFLNLPAPTLDELVKIYLDQNKKVSSPQIEPTVSDYKIGNTSGKKVQYMTKNSTGSRVTSTAILFMRGRQIVKFTYSAVASLKNSDLLLEKVLGSLVIEYKTPKEVTIDTSDWKDYSNIDAGFSVLHPGNNKPYESLTFGDPKSVSFSFKIPLSTTQVPEKDVNSSVVVERWSKDTCQEHSVSVASSSQGDNISLQNGINWYGIYSDVLFASTAGRGYQEIYTSPIINSDHCYRIEMTYVPDLLNDDSRSQGHSVFIEVLKSFKEIDSVTKPTKNSSSTPKAPVTDINTSVTGNPVAPSQAASYEDLVIGRNRVLSWTGPTNTTYTLVVTDVKSGELMGGIANTNGVENGVEHQWAWVVGSYYTFVNPTTKNLLPGTYKIEATYVGSN